MIFIRQIIALDVNDEDTTDVSVGIVPFFHSMGLMVMTLSLLGGRTMIIIKKFNLRQFLQIIQDYKVIYLNLRIN